MRRLLPAVAALVAFSIANASADDLYRCPRAQPGADITAADDKQELCVLGYLFRGSDGHTYGMTSQECAAAKKPTAEVGPLWVVDGRNDFVGERRWAPGKGRVALVRPDFRRIGTYVYQWVASADTTVGIALVRLDRGVPYDATVCTMQGPGRVDDSTTATPQTVRFPSKAVVAPMYDPRNPANVVVSGPSEAFALEGFADPEVVSTTMGGNGAFKGLPVVSSDGLALGIWTGSPAAPHHYRNVVRIGPAIARAERFLGIRLTLLRGGSVGRAG